MDVIETTNCTSNSGGTEWKHIFDHPGWVQILTRRKGNYKNYFFDVEDHVENMHKNSLAF